jgi:hypothetical protein
MDKRLYTLQHDQGYFDVHIHFVGADTFWVHAEISPLRAYSGGSHNRPNHPLHLSGGACKLSQL